MIKAEDILNVTKTDEGYNVELNKSANGFKFFTTPWENIPRFNEKGEQVTPEEFKQSVIDKYGKVFFSQNYACGRFFVDIFDIKENKKSHIFIENLYNYLDKNPLKIKDLLVLTNFGYSEFDGIRKINVDNTVKILLENNKEYIEVTDNHRFIVLKEPIYVKDLKVGDYLETKDHNLVRIIDIKKSNNQTNVYDVLETKDHTYITDNVISHNCEFVGSSYTLINSDFLKKMVSEEPKEVRDGKLKIYEYPKKGHQYIIAVDPAKDGIDAFAVQILDITDIQFDEVACAKLQVDYLIMPEYLNIWGNFYNTAYMIIENNEGAGQSTADILYNSYSYGNMFFEKSMSNNKRKRYGGFRTTEHSRTLILNTLRLFVENNKLKIHDKDTINELFTFVLKGNKYQADEGCHDDMVMSLAIAFAPFNNSRNFEDISKVTKEIYRKNDNYNGEDVQNIAKLLVNASFDDFSDEELDKPKEDDYHLNYRTSSQFDVFGPDLNSEFDPNFGDSSDNNNF